MDRSELEELFRQVRDGATSVEEAVRQVGTSPFEDLGYAKPDLHRGVRTGRSEVIYGASKTAEQIQGIAAALLGAGQSVVLVTRLDDAKAEATIGLLGNDVRTSATKVSYDATSRLMVIGDMLTPDGVGYVVVACAGTSDLYCAEEAALTAEVCRSRVERLYDVGVAGIHRLLSYADVLQGASAVVAVAGMEGALASVIGGLCACPVIACPTSVGYGASFNGLAALLAMLNSCSSGTSVVNIDNGFGAGYQAALIDHIHTRG